MKKRSLVVCAFTLLVFSLGGVSPALAQAGLGFKGWGVRGGLTVDPDQIHLGVHIDAGRFVPQVRFRPSFEVGFGDDAILGAINLDALYLFRARGWSPYAGGGLGVALVDFDRDGRGDRFDDGFDVEAGLNLVGGFEWGPRRQYLLELRAGVGDIPELKVTAGVNF